MFLDIEGKRFSKTGGGVLDTSWLELVQIWLAEHVIEIDDAALLRVRSLLAALLLHLWLSPPILSPTLSHHQHSSAYPIPLYHTSHLSNNSPR